MIKNLLTRTIIAAAITLASSAALWAQGPMTQGRLADIARAIDPDARQNGPVIEFVVDDIPVVMISDAAADRMRAMVPIRSAAGMTQPEMRRVLQANFDTALDARYAIAQGRLWAVFIHPLSSLDRAQLLSGVVQTLNIARSYGAGYSGGANVFGGGDSNDIYQELLDRLLEKGEEL